MRILVMADAGSVHTQRWCQFFEDKGHAVALFSLEPCGITPPKDYYQGKRPTGIGLVDYHLAKKDAAGCISDFKPDVINPQFVVSYGWLAAEVASQPIISTAWGSDLLRAPRNSFMHRDRVKKALEKSLYCIVDGENLRQEAGKYMPSDRIRSMYWGVARNVAGQPVRTEFNTGGPLKIIAPRGLAPVYDAETIINAAVKLRDQIGFAVDLTGHGKRVRRFNDMISNFHLQDMITLITPLPHEEFVASLSQYDVYLSASRSDSTSVALLEAMVSGLCPVVSDIAGNLEWIDSANGFLFKTGDSDSLTEAILASYRQRERFAGIAKRNHAIIRKRGIWEDHMERIENLFKDVLTQ